MEGISSQVATVEYLQLLTVQLQNQDPIDPADQEGLIRDLAQFSMLEGLEDLNTSFADMLKLQERSQGLDLVGKTVQYQNSATGEIHTGRVEEYFTADDSLNLLVNGEGISVDNILSVVADA